MTDVVAIRSAALALIKELDTFFAQESFTREDMKYSTPCEQATIVVGNLIKQLPVAEIPVQAPTIAVEPEEPSEATETAQPIE